MAYSHAENNLRAIARLELETQQLLRSLAGTGRSALARTAHARPVEPAAAPDPDPATI